jgi:beta-glucosidase
MDVARHIVAQLTAEQKASLCLGTDFWHTAAVKGEGEAGGVESVTLSDGPHGLRKKTGGFRDSSEPATCFPTAGCLAGSWDPSLVREVGAALAAEARAQGVDVVLGPGLNIKRHPLCGRNFEYYSEDPYLAGHLAAACVEGIQSLGVGACVKHFAANNQETDRMRVSADIDERTLREIYLSGFEHVITAARPWAVMSSYNRLNGTYTSHDEWLLTHVLRGEWGFDGIVMSDWGAVHDRVAALIAGLDLEMPPKLGVSDAAILRALREGSLPLETLDEAAARVVSLALRARSSSGQGSLDHHELARRAAGESAVLLKNEFAVLPLTDDPGLTIAVLGDPVFQGGGSSEVNPLRVDNVRSELAAALPAVTFVSDPDGADVIIAILTLSEGSDSEGADRTDIDLPEEQTEMLGRLAGTAPIVAVLCTGGVVRTSTWGLCARAIVSFGLAGQAAGGAIADVLTGKVNPSGKLAETVPVRLQDCPAFLNFPGDEGHVRYGEGVFVGYRGYDASDARVSYPFGHGLSYTTFEYGGLTVSGQQVSCTVTNTGSRAGAEVVQLYVGDSHARVRRPVRELRGFTKVSLSPGASSQVTFTLSDRDLSYWSVKLGGWVLEPGVFRVYVGSSSRDIRLSGPVPVTGPAPHVPLTLMSTVSEWLADPEGRDLLYGTIKEVTGRDPADLEALTELIGQTPLSALTGMPVPGVTPEVLAALAP